MQRLHPDPDPISVDQQLDSYRPWEEPGENRPLVAVNFATTVDGRATIGGVSGPIGSSTDTAMLVGLRGRFDAVMIGAGTMRAERYGRIAASRRAQERREEIGLDPDPLMVIVSGRLDLPWDAPLFTDGGGRVLIFTASEAEPPATATPAEIVRHEGFVDIVAALRPAARRTRHPGAALRGRPGPARPAAGVPDSSTTCSSPSPRSSPAATRRASSRATSRPSPS